MSIKIGHESLLKTTTAYFNLNVPELVEIALNRKEAVLAPNGALRTTTGKYTGRSPKDRFIIDEEVNHSKIAWGKINQPISEEVFTKLYDQVLTYLQDKELFVFDGYVGADPNYRLPLRTITEYAWQNLFVHQLFIRPTKEELEQHQPEFTLISAPGFKANPEIDGTKSEAFVILNLKEKIVLIGGTEYAGELKKSVFSIMNFILPQNNVLSMHCSANVGKDGDVSLFFGLSGTGKTTLSADPNRFLIGDDEHGWSDDGVFNIEGGCYAKCIRLSEENEPQIWNAIKFGSVLENVVMDENRQLDFDSDELTENTRAAYPLHFIPGAVIPSKAGHPEVIVFLTADAFGVLPPIAKLSKEQAMYHFLSGYTSKLAGTERGVTEPEATFSTCFGEPFLPLSPTTYAEMLGEKITKHNARVYLVNTGWSGGPYGVGNRMKISYTRAMVTAAINGSIEKTAFVKDPIFGIEIPTHIEGVPDEVLQPKNTWQDKEAYDRYANDLAERFIENFKKFADVSDEIKSASPQVE